MDADDEFFDKALEGLALFAYDKGRSAPAPRARWSRNRSSKNTNLARRPRELFRSRIELSKYCIGGAPGSPPSSFQVKLQAGLQAVKRPKAV
jgi:hypothetical protein